MSGPTLHISEKLAKEYGVKNGDRTKAITDGDTVEQQRDNLRVILGGFSHTLIGPEGDNIRAGQIVEIVVEEKEITLAGDILREYQINDGDTFVVQYDKDAAIDDKPYIRTPAGKVLLRNLARYPSSYREGDIVHIYLFSPSSVK